MARPGTVPAGLPAALRAAALAASLAAGPACAAPSGEADADAGHALHTRYCITCHAYEFGGPDGSAIYTRADRSVTSHAALERQVAQCVKRLELPLTPTDKRNLVGFLNKHYYRFK